ncbi:MAG: hypothetical protein ACJA13_002894 [Paraglaciecola sp.]|jgi:hypothetical protein
MSDERKRQVICPMHLLTAHLLKRLIFTLITAQKIKDFAFEQGELFYVSQDSERPFSPSLSYYFHVTEI